MAPAATSTASRGSRAQLGRMERAACALSTRDARLGLLGRESTIFVIDGQDFFGDGIVSDYFSVLVPV